MRQKFLIVKNVKKNELKIMEYANLDRELTTKDFASVNKEIFSLLYEETYDGKAIRFAVTNGKVDLISALRTQNMYPIGLYADKIADSIIDLYNTKDNRSTELFFDDKDSFTNAPQRDEPIADFEDDVTDTENLLAEDPESIPEDKNEK